MRSFDVDFLSMGQAANLYFQNVKPEKTTEPNKEVVSFQDVLNAKVEQEVKFSKHANQRLENPYSDTSRGIRIGEYHGYGLKNINRIVQENHGDFYTKKKDGVFTVQVRLNCEN